MMLIVLKANKLNIDSNKIHLGQVQMLYFT